MGTLIIAEAGVNHNGDIELAKRLIQEAAIAGADLIKFQTFVTDKNISVTAPKADYQLKTTSIDESQYEMVRKLELSKSDHEVLIKECKRCGISFFSTAFDFDSFDLLVKLGVDRVKIPSGEITNLPFLQYVTRLGLPVILSTGMATLGEVEAAIEIIEANGTSRERITVLHCTTEYPAPYSEVNLHAMVTMGSAFNVDIGYSDHTQGIEVAIAAVAMGAKVIEKHFTLNRDLPGPDHKASLEPHQFRAMVDAIRNVELSLGDGIKRPTPSEVRNKLIARKSLVASKQIRIGEIFTEENITTKRPGTGISPMRWSEVMGKAATRDYEVDELILL
ncbi:N-acetylneuraminate synthase [Pseudomonas juntendi]|uniref:N-acetylneuraminate synthase n=1 Tax=Pseudomonas TaxID=286 RepID=UPI0034D748E1